MQSVIRHESIKDPTPIQIAIWFGLVVIMLWLSLSNYQSYQFGTHFDDSRYVVLARSLVYSDQYGMIETPGQPDPGKYPFGFPLFLIPSIILFPNNFDALKIPSLIATVFNLGILFWGWRWLVKRKSYWWALTVAALYALSPMTISHTRRVMSEPIFTMFCLIAIVLAEVATQKKQSYWWTVAMSVALTFATFTRSIGIVLVVCVFAYLIFVRGKEIWKPLGFVLVQSLVLLGIIVAVTPVQLRDLLPLEYLKDENARLLTVPFAPSENNSEQTTQLPTSNSETFAINVQQKLTTVGNLLNYGMRQHFGNDIRDVALPFGGGEQEQRFAEAIDLPILSAISSYLISIVVILGFIRLVAQEKLSLFLLFALSYFLVLFLWIWNDPRLLYPIQSQIHLALLAAFEGSFCILFKLLRIPLKSTEWKWATALAVIVLAISFMLKSLQIDDSRLHAGDIQARSTWFTTHSNASDVIMTEAPESDYLYSGRKTVPYPGLISSANELRDYLIANRVNYILVAPEIKWQTIYKPYYSTETTELLSSIDELMAKNQVSLVYVSDQELIKAYAVNLETGSAKQ